MALKYDTFEDLLNNHYILSKTWGDMTITFEQESLYEPSSKKRRLIEISAKESFKVDSIILTTASDVFKRMLSHDMQETSTKEIVIAAESLQDADDFYYAMVTNKLRKNANIRNIVKLAFLYEIDIISNQCIDKLIKRTSIPNFISTAGIFERYHIHRKRDQLVKFGMENIKEIRELNEYFDLSDHFKECIFKPGYSIFKLRITDHYKPGKYFFVEINDKVDILSLESGLQKHLQCYLGYQYPIGCLIYKGNILKSSTTIFDLWRDYGLKDDDIITMSFQTFSMSNGVFYR